ncbi:MAG: hypothetical protein Q8P18_16060 [Pseudomonadota bacterium]|nr:hypothetical protein [Pseudomonadota bacterium]
MHDHRGVGRADVARGLVQHVVQHGVEVDQGARDLAAGEPAVGEQVLDEPVHPVAGRRDAPEQLPTPQIELVLVVGEQDLAEAVHRPQGRAQIVGDGVGEGLELAEHLVQLACPLLDTKLQGGIEFLDPRLRSLELERQLLRAFGPRQGIPLLRLRPGEGVDGVGGHREG